MSLSDVDDSGVGRGTAIACPRCHTCCPADQSDCPECDLPLSWLAKVPTAQRTLADWVEGRAAELHISVTWAETTEKVSRGEAGGFSVAAGPLGILEVRWDGNDNSVVFFGDGRRIKIYPPGKVTCDGVILSARLSVPQAVKPAPPPIERLRENSISLDMGGPIVLGSMIATDVRTIELAAADVAHRHCIVVRQPGTKTYWLVDNQSEAGTFVNRQAVVARELEAGDLVQIGPFAWIFNGTDGFLVPVRGIEGALLELDRVEVHGRLKPLSLAIRPGELIAVIGPSGAGKSTFIMAIVGGRRHRTGGTIRLDGLDADTHRDFFRGTLGYVSQQETVHTELQAEQVVQFTAMLRRRPADKQSVERILREVDLPEAIWSRLKRSGGEAKRLRTAAELISEPRLLVLDEPASGLDPDREASLLRLLHSLSYRGCSILFVTHNLTRLDVFDRVVVLGRGGDLRFDGCPKDLASLAPGGDMTKLDFNNIRVSKPLNPSQGIEDSSNSRSPGHRETRFLSQAWWLARREWAVVSNHSLKRFFIPVFLVPLAFAGAIGLAVPTSKPELLGFLAIVACIWMGASLSLMSIVHEREVLEHERLLFLGFGRYIFAKAFVLGVISLLQTLVFVVLLEMIRDRAGGLRAPAWTYLYLSLTGLAAVGLGLVISALAGHSRPLANFILPMAMIFQIVFSVQVAGQSEAPLHDAYGEFTPRYCRGIGCARRAELWVAPPSVTSPDKRSDSAVWVCRRHRSDLKVSSSEDEHAANFENKKRPSKVATIASYLTISRYADIVLRSFAYSDRKHQAFMSSDPAAVDTEYDGYGYDAWRRDALAVLLTFAVGFPLAAVLALWLQERLAALRMQ